MNSLKRALSTFFSSRTRTAAIAGIAIIAAGIAAVIVWMPSGPASALVTIWGDEAPTRMVSQPDSQSVELGTQFTAEKAGTVTAVRFWKLSSQTGSHTGTLWTASGTKLATATFTNESREGWQTARFAAPVRLTAGKAYVVSYFAPAGGYAETKSFTGHSNTPVLSVHADSGVFRYASTSHFPSHRWNNDQYWVDVVFAPHGAQSTTESATPDESGSPQDSATAADTETPTPTPTPTATPTPTVSASASAGPSAAARPGGFPSAANTGVPAGTALTAYTGPCTITAANTVIDAKSISCGTLEIRAKNVVVSRSKLSGTIYTDPSAGLGSFTISDSQIDIGAKAGTGIGDGNFTAVRVHVTGGNRSINCSLNCTVLNSYLHGQFTDSTGVYHESGIRLGSGSVIRGNTIACTAPDVAPDAGCSAAITGYGDFAVVQNDTIDGNLIVAGSGGYCSYGGSTTGKPYSVGTNNIRYTNNVYQRGPSGKCGSYGPVTSFDPSAPGNVWSNNRWDDGTPVSSSD